MHEMIGRELLSVKKPHTIQILTTKIYKFATYNRWSQVPHCVLGVKVPCRRGSTVLPVVLLFSLSFISLHPEGM